MKSKGFVVLASATIVAVAFAIYDFQHEKTLEDRKAENARIVDFKVEQISEIEIQSKDATGKDDSKKHLLLNRTKDGWTIKDPVQELADQNVTQEFLDGLMSEKSEDIVKEGSDIDWKVYGLNEPRGQITVKNSLGETRTFFISSKKNFQGEAFLRVDQQPRVLLVSGTWFSKLDKRAVDFRDKRLLRKSAALITELEQTSKLFRVRLKATEQGWMSPDHPDWALDQNKVRDYLSLFTNPVITEFMTSDQPSPEQEKQWGFTQPLASVQLKFKDGTSWKAAVSEDSAKINYVKISEPAMVGQMTAADAAKFVFIKLDTLRDRKGPFDFKKQDVKKLEIKSAAGSNEFEMKGSIWGAVEKPKPENVVSSDQVINTLKRLSELEVSEFFDKKTPMGQAAQTVVLKNEKNEAVFELSVSSLQRKKIDGQERSFVMAKSSLYPEAFAIDEVRYKNLNLNELLGMKNDH